MTAPPTYYITVMLKTSESTITHKINRAEASNFTCYVTQKSFIGARVKIEQWAWHCPPLGEIL